jgi:hypothetical protein
VFEIDGKRIAQQVLCFTDIVNKVSNHASCLDERETKDEINGNIGACCDKEGGVVTVLGGIRKMDVKPNVRSVVIGTESGVFTIPERMIAT